MSQQQYLDLPNGQFVPTVVIVNPAGTSPVAAYTSRVNLTRPADVLAYLAGDVVGGVLTIASIGPAAGYITITDTDLRIDSLTVIAGMTSFRLQLYNATPPSALVDNAPWDLPAGDRASYMGYVELGTPVDLGSTLYVQSSTVKKLLMGATTSLFGYLVTAGAYTPESATVKSIRINAAAN